MEEKKGYTDVEIIRDAAETLGRLPIPVDLIDTVGMEIRRVRKNLDVVLAEWERVHNAQPALHAVPDGEAEDGEITATMEAMPKDDAVDEQFVEIEEIRQGREA